MAKVTRKAAGVANVNNKAFVRRLGRIEHDLALYQMVNSTAAPAASDASWREGWASGSRQTIKNLLRSIFAGDSSGNVIDVGNHPFTMWFKGTKYAFPGGIVSKLHMGCFPHMTQVDVTPDPTNTSGWVSYPMVGKPGT